MEQKGEGTWTATTADAGCDLPPEWASGAWLFAPMTEGTAEELEEARFELLPHHVVALASDKRDILQEYDRL